MMPASSQCTFIHHFLSYRSYAKDPLYRHTRLRPIPSLADDIVTLLHRYSGQHALFKFCGHSTRDEPQAARVQAAAQPYPARTSKRDLSLLCGGFICVRGRLVVYAVSCQKCFKSSLPDHDTGETHHLHVARVEVSSLRTNLQPLHLFTARCVFCSRLS